MLKPLTIPTTNPSGALIGYENLLTATTTAAADPTLIPNTWERVSLVSGSTTIKYQMSTAAEVDYIGIAAHNLSGESITFATAATVGGATTDIENVSFVDNRAVLIKFTARTVQELILTFNFSVTKEFGYVSMGNVLQMPTDIYGGHSPLNLSGQTDFQSSFSESGQFLGRNIIRKGAKTSFNWQFLEPDFYRDTFQPFVEAAKTKPFFISWRPDRYSLETAFCHTTSDIKPSNMGGHKLMTVSIDVVAHDDI